MRRNGWTAAGAWTIAAVCAVGGPAWWGGVRNVVLGQAVQAQEPPQAEVQKVGPPPIVPRLPAPEIETPVVPTADDLVRSKLNKPISLEFEDQPLADVVDFLRGQLDVQFVLRKGSLDEEGVSGDTPISLQLKEVPAAHALRVIEDALHIRFAVHDGIVFVAGQGDMQLTLRRQEVKVYNCRDLLRLAPAGGAPQANPDGSQDVQSPSAALIEVIVSVISPQDWDAAGGPSSVKEFNGLLTVRAVAETQAQVDKLLTQMRHSARDELQAR